MKKIVICFILIFCVSNFLFSNEKEISNMEIKNINTSSNPYYYFDKLNLSINNIFIGTTFLGSSSFFWGTILSFIPFEINDDFDLLVTSIGQSMLGMVGAGLLIAGSILTSVGNINYKKRVKMIDNNTLSSYYMKKSKNFLKIAIPNIAISGVTTVISTTGIVLTVLGYNTYGAAMTVPGIFLDVFGGIGLAVCLPMMIASLAMSAWCKGQLAKLTPELTLAHDSKKDITEGYSVRMGLRVRI